MTIPGRSEKQTEEWVSDYLVRHAAGDDDEAIRASTGLSHAQFRQLKREVTARDVHGLHDQKTADIFVEYRRKQYRLARRLEVMADGFRDGGQASPQVAAINAISNLYDRVIRTGQEMGVIEKAPERSQVSGAFMFSDMSNAALRKFVTGIAVQSEELLGRYGTQNIVDAEFGQVYYALPEDDGAGDKHNRAVTARVSGGRRSAVARRKAL